MQLIEHEVANFNMTKLCRKVALVDENMLSTMQNRFVDAQFALCGTTEVTRRDGLSSLNDNILSPVGMLIVDPKISKSQMLTHLAPQNTAEVTRRDGASSLKSNILSPVGMLSGSWGGTYV